MNSDSSSLKDFMDSESSLMKDFMDPDSSSLSIVRSITSLSTGMFLVLLEIRVPTAATVLSLLFFALTLLFFALTASLLSLLVAGADVCAVVAVVSGNVLVLPFDLLKEDDFSGRRDRDIEGRRVAGPQLAATVFTWICTVFLAISFAFAPLLSRRPPFSINSCRPSLRIFS